MEQGNGPNVPANSPRRARTPFGSSTFRRLRRTGTPISGFYQVHHGRRIVSGRDCLRRWSFRGQEADRGCPDMRSDTIASLGRPNGAVFCCARGQPRRDRTGCPSGWSIQVLDAQPRLSSGATPPCFSRCRETVWDLHGAGGHRATSTAEMAAGVSQKAPDRAGAITTGGRSLTPRACPAIPRTGRRSDH